MSRSVTLVLVDGAGAVLGSLPPFEVGVPHWQEVADVAAVARDRFGVDVDVLRLVHAERSRPPGGGVVYAAQVHERPTQLVLGAVDPATVTDDHPRRAAYARLGGPAASTAWATDRLGPLRHVAQQRTWNLSAIWRLTTADDTTCWLKQVPSFFAHEATVLGWIGTHHPGLVPPLVAHGVDGRMLLAHVPGDDQYGAGLAVRHRLVDRAHRFQRDATDAVGELVAAGVPDRRGPALTAWIGDALAPWVTGHPAEAVLHRLDAVMAAVDACGVPATLVHGDAHPGNSRGAPDELALLDFGDAFIGHPAFDVLTLTSDCGDADRDALVDQWVAHWRRLAPRSDPRRAVELLRPVAALRLAAVFASFVAGIEPSEWPYHAPDVPDMLDVAARSA